MANTPEYDTAYCNDIYSNIEYINSYLTKNKIINRKVLSLTANCIDSYVLECSLINLGCSLNFASKSRLLDVQFNLDFDIILVDTIIDINVFVIRYYD